MAARVENTSATPNDEFPILCETCLGENPFIRMTKQPWGKACKICDRPFTVYRWKPGPKARYKKTELCHTCAKLKNVCQTCVLDLAYGLPVQVRDSTLEEWEKVVIPFSDVNREYMIEEHEKKMQDLDPSVTSQYGKVSADAAGHLSKMKRRTPYYRRNLPHVCSFFAKGTCNRGRLCPYRHEMPVTGELANQNIKDRYYGQNDPVAKKMLARQADRQSGGGKELVAPGDTSITTLWVGGATEAVSESDIRGKFGVFGTLSDVRMVTQKKCAFVTFARRQDAESAAQELQKDLVCSGVHMRIAWGQKRAAKAGPPGVKGPPGVRKARAPAASYPSQDPRNMAAKFS